MECHICFAPAEKTCPKCQNPTCNSHLLAVLAQGVQEGNCHICQHQEPDSPGWNEKRKSLRERYAKSYELVKSLGQSLATPEGEHLLTELIGHLAGFVEYLDFLPNLFSHTCEKAVMIIDQAKKISSTTSEGYVRRIVGLIPAELEILLKSLMSKVYKKSAEEINDAWAKAQTSIRSFFQDLPE